MPPDLEATKVYYYVTQSRLNYAHTPSSPPKNCSYVS